MGERRQQFDIECEEIIAAFDREQAEAHELHRRYREIISNSRRNDRQVPSGDHEQHR